jgi:hypothetical protein
LKLLVLQVEREVSTGDKGGPGREQGSGKGMGVRVKAII